MPIDIDKALGNLPTNLQVYSRRSSLLATNIANADTPGYKARDMDFRAVLDKAAGASAVQLRATQKGHIGFDTRSGPDAPALYRVPLQPSLDGNTVDLQTERAEFTQNAVRYQSTLTFLNGRFKGLLTAIKGE